jgi:hypothetical protein
VQDLEHLMEVQEVLEVLLFQILINKINVSIIFRNLIILEKKQDMKDQEDQVVISLNKLEVQEVE